MIRKIIVLAITFVFFVSCSNSSKIQGTWYDDHGDTLVLTKDGAFTSSWLSSGSYIAQKNIVTLSSVFGDIRILEYTTAPNGEQTLCFNDGERYYYLDEIIAEQENRRRIELEQQEEEERRATAIDDFKKLIIGEWSLKNGSATMTANETELIFHLKGTEFIKEETKIIKYEVLPEEGKLYIDIENGYKGEITASIIEKDGEYVFWGSNFPYDRKYYRSID